MMTRLHTRPSGLFTLFWLLVLAAWCGLLPARTRAEETPRAVPPQVGTVSEGMGLMRAGIAGNMCTLTFDDGPSKYTAALLDILKEYGVPATFFVVGTQVERRPELIRRMMAEGHEVGNHSYSHNALRKQAPKDQEADLRKLDDLLRELGVTPRFVRPPYGFYDHNTVNVVQEMDGHIVMWSVDSQDWRKKGELEDVLKNMQTLYTGAPLRGVFLFHDTHRMTVENMPRILDALKASGCRFVTLSEFIDATSPKTEPDSREAHSGPEKNVQTQAQPGDSVPATPPAKPAGNAPNGTARSELAPQNPVVPQSSTTTLSQAWVPAAQAPTAGPDFPAPSQTPSSRVMAWIFGRVLLLPEKSNGLPH